MIPAVSATTGAGAAGLTYQWVAAGSNGELYTTTSTTVATGSWTSRTSSFGTTTIRAVASNGTSLYVAVGDSGKLATSADGVTWTQQTSSFGTTNIWSVAYGNGYWVAGGASGTVAYSTDGTTWTQKTTGISGTVVSTAWGNGLWIVGNSAGAMYTATDPTGTWTSRTSTLGSVWGLLYFKAQSIWVAGHDTGTTNALASSTDGTTWTARNSAITLNAPDVLTFRMAANTSVCAILGATGTLVQDIETSTNGTTWTDRTPAVSSGTPSFGASDNNGLLVFSGIQTSSDGTTWTSQTAPSSNLVALCHSSGTPSLR